MLASEILTEWWRDLLKYSLPKLKQMLNTAEKGTDEYKDISKAIASKEKEIAKVGQQRSELQKVTSKIETDPEKLALQKQIQTYRGELSKRERERRAQLAKLEELRANFEKMDTAALKAIMKSERKNSDFYKFIKDIVDSRAAKQDLLRSVSGSIKQGTSIGTKAAADAPWVIMGLKGGRKEFRKILNNPQHPKHTEARKLQSEYKGTE